MILLLTTNYGCMSIDWLIDWLIDWVPQCVSDKSPPVAAAAKRLPRCWGPRVPQCILLDRCISSPYLSMLPSTLPSFLFVLDLILIRNCTTDYITGTPLHLCGHCFTQFTVRLPGTALLFHHLWFMFCTTSATGLPPTSPQWSPPLYLLLARLPH